jgi:Phage DNA packaging protein Nu1
MVLNREKLAEVLGCSLRTIDEYTRQGMPGEPPKHGGDQWRFDPAASVDWLRERERKVVLGDIAKINETEARRQFVYFFGELFYEPFFVLGRAGPLHDVCAWTRPTMATYRCGILIDFRCFGWGAGRGCCEITSSSARRPSLSQTCDRY